MVGSAAGQVPAPEQVGAGVKVVPVQVAVPQVTLTAACVQTPAPLQVPVFPQGGAAVHCPTGAAAPGPTNAQLPALR